MQPTIWTIEIPDWHPVPVNKLINSHWGTAKQLKDKDKRIMGYALTAYGVPHATGKRKVNLSLVYGPKERAVDPDASFKSLFDALVYYKALKNDSHEWVEYEQPVVLRGPHRKCFVTIQDL